MWPITLSGRLPIVALVGRYLTNQLIGRELTPNRIAPFTSKPCDLVVLCGISTCFQVLSPCLGQIAHALLTRPPLKQNNRSLSVSARLACVKHAASVRPEPGSNSDVQSFPSTPSPAQTRQSPRFLPRQGVSLIRNLTVLPCLLFLSVSFSRIARSLVDFMPSLATTLIIIAASLSACQPLFSIFLKKDSF